GKDSSTGQASLKFAHQPDQMCLQCHTAYATKIEAHTRHPAQSEGSRCVSCHMPRIMRSLLFKARTHEIDNIPDVEMTERFGQEESPNACLICHRDKDASGSVFVGGRIRRTKKPFHGAAQPQPNMKETTDEHRSCSSVLLIRTPLQAAKDFPAAGSWERTHPACRGVGHPGHAGSVRSQGRNLRVSAVRFFLVAAELLRVHLWFL